MAGSRYLSRGVDNNGNVATFVETEQIVSCDHFYVSNIILRGSIPVFWSQNNSKFKPNPTLVGSESDSWSSFTKHFSNLTKSYSESLKIVNLIKNDGREEQLFNIFTKFSNLYISEINNKAEYLHFNFAKEK
ncbi:MAG: Phosphatidylinositide phosphatase SAC2 [Paramarteilia canceri]